jgi:hypothetical protein
VYSPVKAAFPEMGGFIVPVGKR